MTSDPAGGDLAQRLRQAGERELLRLVEESAGELDARLAAQILRNPYAGGEVVEILLAQRALLRHQEIRSALAAHPATPETHALRLVPTLFWRDLVRLGADSRVRPRVRRAADRHLGERLAGLAVGEKMTIARRCGPGLIARLRHDPSTRVMEALLENPRLTEGSLMPLLGSDTARPEVLAQIARDRRWGSRYPIRVALCRNPKTPQESALALLPLLKKQDLRAVASDPRLPAGVRRRADLLLGRSGC